MVNLVILHLQFKFLQVLDSQDIGRHIVDVSWESALKFSLTLQMMA